MKPKNLLSVYQGAGALELPSLEADRRFKPLKSHEIDNLRSLCNILSIYGCTVADFDGFYVSYTIDRISKEFDLLRFGTNCIINIELKAAFERPNKQAKILKQMRANAHYLSFLGRPIHIFTYADVDGFYMYDPVDDSLTRTTPAVVAQALAAQEVDLSLDPDLAFVPANYLVSPFRDSGRFMRGEYFLTTAQQTVKDEFNHARRRHPFMLFSIAAGAGTGKTLLLYDMAKTAMDAHIPIALIHCAPLSEGHVHLRDDHQWPIFTATDMDRDDFPTACALLFVDEVQRLSKAACANLINWARTHRITTVLAWDSDPQGAALDVQSFLAETAADLPVETKRLTAKIRPNKEMASFIANLFKIGSGHTHRDYDSVSVDYLDNKADLHAYSRFLRSTDWTSLEEMPSLESLGGQEFDKVVVIMDHRFYYDPSKRLCIKQGHTQDLTALYQMVTRAKSALKIIVFNDPTLYLTLLKIRALGDRE